MKDWQKSYVINTRKYYDHITRRRENKHGRVSTIEIPLGHKRLTDVPIIKVEGVEYFLIKKQS